MTKDEALRYAANTFDGYAKHHEAKGDMEKCYRNEVHAQVMRKALKEPTIRKSLIVEPTVSNSLKVQTEALRMAEEALAEIHPGNMTPMAEKSWNKALTAIRKALVDAVDTSEKRVDETVECGHEPVAQARVAGWYLVEAYFNEDGEPTMYREPSCQDVEPVKQEPVAWMLECPTMTGGTGWKLSWTQSGGGVCNRLHGVEHEKPLYTAPQPHQWVELTDAEINEVYEKWGAIPYLAAIHTVIAKYKEKNQV